MKKAWGEYYMFDHHILFGAVDPNVNVLNLHPPQMHIFQLWQTFIDNVNPLLQIVHASTLQKRILAAINHLANADPATTALMFGVYCISVMSLSDDECVSTYGSPKKDLLTQYQFGSQQALLQAKFLQTADRECLTAFYLYLVSVAHESQLYTLTVQAFL